MEQHSLHEEPGPQPTLSEHEQQPDDPAAPNATESATPIPSHPQHEHSDSMVTIRLSKTDDAEVKKEDITLDTSVGSGRIIEHDPVNTSSDSSADETEEPKETKEQDSERESTPSTEETVTVKAISPATDNDVIESPVEADAVDTDVTGATLEIPNRASLTMDQLSKRASREVSAEDLFRQSATLGSELERAASRARSMSSSSSKSSGSGNVNWTELDKNEEHQEKDDATDESTAFLLARLEQENNALATNPKAQISRGRSESRPPSYQQLKRLVQEPQNSSLRYSLLPAPPPMTELEFWTALVRNYPQTALRLPTLTSNKIRSGIPAPLRGVVWQSIAGSRETALELEYERLSLETSPHERVIAKDVGRSFPGVDMFRDPDGEGQKMLGKVLNAFSMYDTEIGYCQGLGFVVGPLIMHMGEKEAFCTLVRLMMQYDLRSCYLPDLSGLHLRIYQFQHLLSEHLPAVTEHLDKLAIEPLYLSQWFLSFFGTTCPLPMLIRIYDVILTEGASETLLRVGLSLMRRNEKKILASAELEDVMQLLISRSLWDTYGCNADDLVQDFCEWTGLVTREKLQMLEESFKISTSPTSTSKPSVHTAAARFLGRIWTGTSGLISPKSPSAASLIAPGRPVSTLRRTASKQSMASTLNSVEGSDSSTITEATEMSRQTSGGDWVPQKPTHAPTASVRNAQNKDKDLHSQIEDLLHAMGDLQREHSQLASDLQREREERDEDRSKVKQMIEQIKESKALDVPSGATENSDQNPQSVALTSLTELEQRFTSSEKRSSLMHQSKQQLHDEVQRWKTLYNQEVLKSSDLTRQLSDQEREVSRSKESLREARSRIQSSDREKQRLEKANQDLRSRSRGSTVTESDNPSSHASESSSTPPTTNTSGLREFKLGRASTSLSRSEQSAMPSPQFSKRMSSLSTHSILATEDHKPASEDALLVELVASKTSEAVARQELEEVKAKLDSLRKLMSSNAAAGEKGDRNSPPVPVIVGGSYSTKKEHTQTPSLTAASAIGIAGGFFNGWGKRAASSST